MGPDDPAYLRDELLLDPELVGQLGEELGGGDVPEVELTACLDGRPDLLDDGRHLALAAARPFVGDDLARPYPQHGPDVEGGPTRRCALPMRPLFGEILQRAHGEEDVGPPDSPLRRAPDVVEVPALVDDSAAPPAGSNPTPSRRSSCRARGRAGPPSPPPAEAES